MEIKVEKFRSRIYPDAKGILVTIEIYQKLVELSMKFRTSSSIELAPGFAPVIEVEKNTINQSLPHLYCEAKSIIRDHNGAPVREKLIAGVSYILKIAKDHYRVMSKDVLGNIYYNSDGDSLSPGRSLSSTNDIIEIRNFLKRFNNIKLVHLKMTKPIFADSVDELRFSVHEETEESTEQ